MILERLPDPVIVLARDRSVQRANAAARAAFGEDIAAVLRNPGLRGAIDRALSTRAAQTAEIGLRCRCRGMFSRPRCRWTLLWRMAARCWSCCGPDAEGVVERMRADFVADVSHELRLPLVSLIGFVETLRGPAADDPPAQQRFLEIMGEQVSRMDRLIDDLLSLSRIESPSISCLPRRLIWRKLTRMVAGFEPRLTGRK